MHKGEESEEAVMIDNRKMVAVEFHSLDDRVPVVFRWQSDMVAMCWCCGRRFECHRCGGGPLIVTFEAAVDPTGELEGGVPVYVVKQLCHKCGHDQDLLMKLEPDPDACQ